MKPEAELDSLQIIYYLGAKEVWAGLPLNHCGLETWSCLLFWPLPDLLCLTSS